MLPFHLKPVRQGRGDKAKGSVGYQEPTTTTTTTAAATRITTIHPLQKAVLDDLRGIQERFFQQQQQCLLGFDNTNVVDDEESPHSAPGTVFRVFQNEFRTSRGALLHLLCPPRCDREAYSQVLYATGLNLLREAFENETHKTMTTTTTTETHTTDDTNKDNVPSILKDAGFAVFCLWALWETNPLPRGVDNPLELLTVGLRDLEDPRTLYRRYFCQNIRIDRSHFHLLLRLRELAVSNQAACQEDWCIMRLRRRLQNAKPCSDDDSQADDHSAETIWSCSCGFATDILEILSRLFSKLDLCEYIGPVGMEALASHPDYHPYGDLPPISLGERGETSEPNVPSTTFQLSTQIATGIDEYQKQISGIRVPPAKTSFAVRRLRGSLLPFTSSVTEESWESVKEELFSTSERTAQVPRARQRHQSHNPSSLMLNNDNISLQEENQPENLLGKGHKSEQEEAAKAHVPQEAESRPKYTIVIPSGIDGDRKHHLMACLSSLIERERPLPPLQIPRRTEIAPLLADDVSSVGYSGASIGTGYGRKALRKLLSQAHGVSGRQPQVRGTTKSNNNASDTGTGARVIQNDSASRVRTLECDFLDQDVSDDDAESVESELTLQSFLENEEDSDGDEMSSVATSAVGKRALEDLLGAVVQGEINTAPRKLGKKRKSSSLTTDNQARGKSQKRRSIPVDAGRDALSMLLDRAMGSTTSDRAMESTTSDYDDVDSLAKSIGPGRNTLDALLSKVSKGE